MRQILIIRRAVAASRFENAWFHMLQRRTSTEKRHKRRGDIGDLSRAAWKDGKSKQDPSQFWHAGIRKFLPMWSAVACKLQIQSRPGAQRAGAPAHTLTVYRFRRLIEFREQPANQGRRAESGRRSLIRFKPCPRMRHVTMV